jgi:hypothetical protein
VHNDAELLLVEILAFVAVLVVAGSGAAFARHVPEAAYVFGV